MQKLTNRLLGFLKRNLHHCPSGLKEMAYKQLILPCLEYYASIHDPFHHNLTNQLEMIQHRAARFVLNRPWIKGHHDSIRLEPNMLKNLPIILSRTSQKFYLFFFIPIVPPLIPFLFYCVNDNITMQE